jgi:3-deoxy-D-manno-octulosonic-acid transferase
MRLIYDLGIALISAYINVGSLFNKKLKLLKEGRAEVWEKLKQNMPEGEVIWIHAASLGEFEQGRPLIEAIKDRYREKKIVLTFFSPSGYEVRKNYDLADVVLYLPADTTRNAKRFIDIVQPEMAFFIKYEFWYHFIKELDSRDISVYGVSVIFRDKQPFFRWYGHWFRNILRSFKHFYLQDARSAKMLESIGMKNYTVAGDTRFDRVSEIAASASEIGPAQKFSEGYRTIVAGSSWPPDEKILTKYINNAPDDVKMIIAPHVIDEAHIRQIEEALNVPSFRITNVPDNPQDYKVMIVNTIGMLSAIYRYGKIAYIGGGFGIGIHNTLEAAVYGIPVLFGPNYKRFKEANDLIEKGGGFVIKNYEDFKGLVDKMWADTAFLEDAGKKAGDYVKSMCGATELIMKDVFSIDNV